MKRILVFVFVMALVGQVSAACAQLAPAPTATPQPTTDVRPIQTNAVGTAFSDLTQAAVSAKQTLAAAATATGTSTPRPTPTITNTPDATQTIQAVLYGPHPPGFYLAGTEIGYGVWRAPKGFSKCYWETLDLAGNIIQNENGPSGGTVYVGHDVYMVHFDDGSSRSVRCPAVYEYIGPG